MRKVISTFIVVIMLLCASCTINVPDKSTSISTVDSGERILASQSQCMEISTTEIEIPLEDLVLKNFQIDYSDIGSVRMTGEVSEHILIDAELICTVDPEEPGFAAGYTFQLEAKLVPIRYMYVQADWTPTDYECFFKPAAASNDGAFFDTYTDMIGHKHVCYTTDQFFMYCTPRGVMIKSFGQNMSEEYCAKEDFEFASAHEAYKTAKIFLEKSGASISPYYEVRRLSNEELEVESLFHNGDEPIPVEKLLPNGWTQEEDAYLFTLFEDIAGMPVYGSGCAYTVVITSRGVEYAGYLWQYDRVYKEQSTKMLCSVTEALGFFSHHLHSVHKAVNQDHMSLYSSHPILVDKVSLMYMSTWDNSMNDYVFRPFWIIHATQQTEEWGSCEDSYYIDALTGNLLQTTPYQGSEEE